MRVMGIDPSKTATGVVVVAGAEGWGKECFTGTIKRHADNDVTDGLHKAKMLGRILDVYDPDLVVFEGFAYGNQKTLAILVAVRTCLEIAVRMRKVPYLIVAPSQVTKFVVPGTNRKKEDTKLATYKRWGFEDESNDIVDAYCLAQIGWAWEHESCQPGGKSLKLTKPQTEVLGKLNMTWVDASS